MGMLRRDHEVWMLHARNVEYYNDEKKSNFGQASFEINYDVC